MTRVIFVKRTTLIAATAAALLLLAGCSGTTQESVTSTSEPVGSPAATDAAPLSAQTPEARVDGGEAAFLEAVRANLRPDNVIPDATDEQLIAAGQEACDARAAGQATDTISVIDGEEPVHGYYRDSLQIVQAAAENLC